MKASEREIAAEAARSLYLFLSNAYVYEEGRDGGKCKRCFELSPTNPDRMSMRLVHAEGCETQRAIDAMQALNELTKAKGNRP